MQTFNCDMEDTHKTWIFPFAHLVLMYERMLSADDKVGFQQTQLRLQSAFESSAALTAHHFNQKSCIEVFQEQSLWCNVACFGNNLHFVAKKGC